MFCNILVMWGTISQLCMLLGSWRRQITLDCEKLSSPDALKVILVKCFMAWSTALEFTVLGLPDLATQVKFLEPCSYWTMINHAFTFCIINVFVCFHEFLTPVQICKGLIFELVYVAHSLVHLSNHTRIRFGLFGLVLWHINHCRQFNTKSSLYIYQI